MQDVYLLRHQPVELTSKIFLKSTIMKKLVKWLLITFASFLVLIILAGILIPIFFKKDIQEAVNKQLANAVNADVSFNIDKVHVTLFKNFPNLTVEVEELGVVNREPFDGEVLFASEKFGVEVNLSDLLFGDQLKVKGVSVYNPIINVKVLKDGRANYDIAMPSSDTIPTKESESTAFSFGIDHWEMVNASIVYDDQSMPYYLEIKGLNHQGSGDFNQNNFDLTTYTTADSVTTSYDGMEFLTNKRAEIDAVIQISENFSKYTFKKNKAKVNDFAMSFDGWFKMNENDFGMDISYNSPENSFKSLLSLVPGMYTSSFDGIETKGDLSFNGFVRGTYSDNQMPAFSVAMLVKDAMFKYPDLPTAVTNINLDLLVNNEDGILDNTSIDLKTLHLDFGSNPFDASLLIENLKDYRMKAQLATQLNLAELTKMFPIDGIELRGTFAAKLTAQGVYDSINKTIPTVNATLSLVNGFVKSADFPLPLENVRFASTLKNTSGKMAETFVAVKDFGLVLDGEKFAADMTLQNLDNYTWDVQAKGGVDLEKMTKIFPLEGMSMVGKVIADIRTQGMMSDVDAERYDKLPTSGTISLSDFKYSSKDLAYALAISQAAMSFDPKKIELTSTIGTIGKSDFALSGSLSNYMAYIFGKNEVIKGSLDFTSTLLDLNEFMVETEPETVSDSSTFGVIPIPENIDFILRSKVGTAKIMDYTLSSAKGDVVLKDGIANLNGLTFVMLGGTFGVDGTYTAKDINHPTYDLSLKIDKLSIQESANSFSIVKTFAPVAGLVNGTFSTDFKIKGELTQEMMPDMATVNASGLIRIAQAALKDSKLVSGITALTKLDNTSDVTLRDVLMSATIKDGRLSVKPFDVSLGNYKTTIVGSSGLDGSIDYVFKMNVPASKLSNQVAGFASKYTGSSADPNRPIPLTIGVGGKYNDPKTTLILDEQREQAKAAVTTAAKEEATKKVTELAKGTEAEKLVNAVLGGEKKASDSTKSTTVKEDLTKKAQEEAAKKIKSLLKKKKN